jgi:taurine transport system permease protein
MTAIEQAPSELAETKSRLVLRPRVEHLLTAGTVVGLLGLWTLLSHYGLVNPLFLPSPEAVWTSFLEVVTEGYQGQRLHQHMAASLERILAGYFMACAICITLGLLTALPPLSISAMQAARSIDLRHVRAAQMLGATRAQLFRHVFLPSCLPGICTGMRISLGFTYTVLVASEIVAATAGMGWMIWDASKFLLSDVVIMGLFVLGLTGVALDWAIRQFERLITPWRFA